MRCTSVQNSTVSVPFLLLVHSRNAQKTRTKQFALFPWGTSLGRRLIMRWRRKLLLRLRQFMGCPASCSTVLFQTLVTIDFPPLEHCTHCIGWEIKSAHRKHKGRAGGNLYLTTCLPVAYQAAPSSLLFLVLLVCTMGLPNLHVNDWHLLQLTGLVSTPCWALTGLQLLHSFMHFKPEQGLACGLILTLRIQTVQHSPLRAESPQSN